MTENYGFSEEVKVTKRKLEDIHEMVGQCRRAYRDGFAMGLGFTSCFDAWDVLTRKQRNIVSKKEYEEMVYHIMVKSEDIVHSLHSEGKFQAYRIARVNDTYFDETRHTPNATPTHIVVSRDSNGMVSIVEQFASFTEAKGFVDDMGFGEVVEL